MQNLIFVAIGGGIGASLRYGVGIAAGRLLGAAFPWGTLLVNLAGCFVMGLVGQWLLDLEPQLAAALARSGVSDPSTADLAARAATVRHLIAIGFLGGLTTFSTFSWDTLRALESGRLSIALLNVAANVCLCLVAVWAGASLLRATS